MTSIGTVTKNTYKEELYSQYNWFKNAFLNSIQASSDEFFSDIFSFQLISVSKNVNVLFQGDDYFVTKIRLDKQNDVFFRCSESAIQTILEKILGNQGERPDKKVFSLSSISELEAKIISSFNDYLYQGFANFLAQNPPEPKQKSHDTIHLTFYLKEKTGENGGKIIISLPANLLTPESILTKSEKFTAEDFKNSLVEVSIRLGTTKFPVKELKKLEIEDIVVFENSNIQSMQLVYENYTKIFRITPNPGLIMTIENNDGGKNMEDHSLSQNLWDNIQVEMGAEFEKVKISLGELKNIEQGLVVDISSVYDNKISLKVENKTIAKGELVIINDRYGVRIDEIFASEEEKTEHENIQESDEAVTENSPAEEESNEDENFDYSDFELDDQDI